MSAGKDDPPPPRRPPRPAVPHGVKPTLFGVDMSKMPDSIKSAVEGATERKSEGDVDLDAATIPFRPVDGGDATLPGIGPSNAAGPKPFAASAAKATGVPVAKPAETTASALAAAVEPEQGGDVIPSEPPTMPDGAMIGSEPAEAANAALARAPSTEGQASADVTAQRPAAGAGKETPSLAVRRDLGEQPAGLRIKLFGQTDVGLVREHNEDNFLVANLSAQARGVIAETRQHLLGGRGTLVAVCDGMGGAAAGEVASQMAVDTLYERLQGGSPPRDRDDFARRLVRAIEEAGSRIFTAAKLDRSRRGMGTTSTVAGLVDRTLFVGQVGDSRAYLLRGEHLALVTKDQSLVNQLIEAGQLTPEEAEQFEHSNIILQALGTAEQVHVDLTFLELRRGDRLMLCSDGLSGLVHPDMIREALLENESLEACCAKLIEMARNGGGHDNITVVVVDFDGQDLPESAPNEVPGYMQYPLPPGGAEDDAGSPTRDVSMKPASSKPGSDVKGYGSARATRSRGSALRWALVVALVVAAIVVVGAVIVVGFGMHAGLPRSDGLIPGFAQEPSPPVAQAQAQALFAPAPGGSPASLVDVVVRSDLPAGGELYIDGVGARPIASGETHVQLAPGAYRFEARTGGAFVAAQTVMVRSGMAPVTLDVPQGAAQVVADTASPPPSAPNAPPSAAGADVAPAPPSAAADTAPSVAPGTAPSVAAAAGSAEPSASPHREHRSAAAAADEPRHSHHDHAPSPAVPQAP